MEAAAAHGHHHEEGAELFTRAVQSTVGMARVLAFSVALRCSPSCSVVYSRTGDITARTLSVLVAGAMLISLWVVPALKHPPNPPATSLDTTIKRAGAVLHPDGRAVRTADGGRGVSRQPAGAAVRGLERDPAAGAAHVVAVAVLMLVPPTVDETPGPIEDAAGTIVPSVLGGGSVRVPVVALGTQVIIWTTIGRGWRRDAVAVAGHKANRAADRVPTFTHSAGTDGGGRLPASEPRQLPGDQDRPADTPCRMR